MTHLELQMENGQTICLKRLVNNVTEYLTGGSCQNSSIVKVNNDNLSKNGDLCFLPGLKAWKCILEGENTCDQNCTTILQHFLHLRGIKVEEKTDAQVVNEVFQLLVSTSENWLINVEKCSLREQKVCLFLSRKVVLTNSIKTAILSGENYGKSTPLNKVFGLKSYRDPESELTTVRLNLIKKVTENILALHGSKVSEEDSEFKIMFTTKSEGNVEENYKKHICGVVKNTRSGVKETSLTWVEYIENKNKETEESNERKYFGTEEKSLKNSSISKDIAKAVTIFELMAVKPTRPVFIGRDCKADKSVTNTKGASFVLYNTARMATIFEKYNSKRLQKEYPELPNIDDVDFSVLDQEEEWELVFNFILGYQEMIKDCLKYKPTFQSNPQVICLFLTRLCQKFSIYYRRIRILTEAYDHLIPTMMARLYMVQALWTVLSNALALMNIDPLSRM